MPSTKISALARSEPNAGLALLPGAQGSANVALPFSLLLNGRPPAQLCNDGDSKGGEPIAAARWVAAEEGLDAVIGAQAFWVGGSNSGSSGTTNLTSTARLATMQAGVSARVATGAIVDMVLTVGTNDIVLASIAPETILANVRKYHAAFRAAGGRFLIIMAVDPRTGLTAAQARQFIALNRGYAAYCQTVPDAIFCDTSPWLLDFASSNTLYAIAGAATGAAFTMAADGLHLSAFGNYRKKFALAPVLRSLYRPRTRSVLHLADVYNATDAIRGNVLGANGRMISIGGTNTATNGTVTGTPPLGWTLSGNLQGLTLDFSVQTVAALNTLYAATGAQAVRMTVSGTPTANTAITLLRNVLFADQGATPMLGDFLLSANALAGCFGFQMAMVNGAPNTINQFLGSGSAVTGLVASDQLPQLDGLLGIDMYAEVTSSLNSGISLSTRFLSGVAVSGSIDLIGGSWRRRDPIPAAAP